MRALRGVAAGLFLLLLGAWALEAQDPPPADEIIDRYVEAIGGRDAFVGLSSVRMVGTIEMPALGLRGEFELLQAAPDRMLMRMSLPQIGEALSGYDGEVGWSDNPLTGPSLMEGDELAQTAELANVLAHLRDPELVPERETVERSEHAGEACWRVRLVWASGRESFDCFSEETGLLLVSQGDQATQMGRVPVTTVYSEYEEADGVRFPARMVQETMGQSQVVTIREIRVNSVDASELEPPARIRTLLD